VAWHGTADHMEEVFTGMEDASLWLGNGATLAIARLGRAIVDVARGNYQAACATAQEVIRGTRLGMEARALPTLVEAAVRAGEDDVAAEASHRLDVMASAAATPWGLGVRARARALVLPDAEAEPHYLESIGLLAPTPVRSELARSHLVYGEWLRRRKRRADARRHLADAHRLFVGMGAMAFAERARAELAAIGGRPQGPSATPADDLTAQEAQIARLAAQGDTNAEIAARLYISARTVDYHLRKVFRKLDVASRRDLARALGRS
jgi:DNA-binding CsgD family transcriptional regulator